MDDGFQKTLDHIRSIAESEVHKGRLFERLMKTYFTKDPIYRERFAAVWLWSEWAANVPTSTAPIRGSIWLPRNETAGATAPSSASATPLARESRSPISIRSSPPRRANRSRPASSWTPATNGGPTARKAIAHLKPACFVLRFGDLASRPFDWPDLGREEPEDLSYRHEPFSLRPHQQAAFDDVIEGFQTDDRGKLVMACGTGKTFVALRIAEAVAGIGGRALYLVPAIALFAQAMREWATQQAVPHRYIGICSDTTAGRKTRTHRCMSSRSR